MSPVSLINAELPGVQIGPHVQALQDEHKTEALEFLATRPLHTFIQTSWIRDNGLLSPLNRGTFYGHRNGHGQLDGVALIGHVTLFETSSNAAVSAFAELARRCSSVRTILAERELTNQFLNYYAKDGSTPRRICSDLLLEKHTATSLSGVTSFRPARPEELEMLVPIHARLAFEESGLNPLDIDRDGFKERCARRIEQGRVWVAIEDGRLEFKIDIVSDTPEVVYLEGTYVGRRHRGNGFGARCLNQLTNHLLERTKSVCLLVNENNAAAQASYRRAGYELRDYYSTLFR